MIRPLAIAVIGWGLSLTRRSRPPGPARSSRTWARCMCRKPVPIFLSFVLMAGPVLAGSGPEGQQKPLVFTHITVIDATGAAARPGRFSRTAPVM